jgi:hypothetical protein
MKLLIEKEEIFNLMRRAGYISLGRGINSEEFSFIRPLGLGGYPRFHLFIRFDQGKEAILNIHLDQKKAVYKGSRAHSADYDGPVIDIEIERIKNIINER